MVSPRTSMAGGEGGGRRRGGGVGHGGGDGLLGHGLCYRTSGGREEASAPGHRIRVAGLLRDGVLHGETKVRVRNIEEALVAIDFKEIAADAVRACDELHQVATGVWAEMTRADEAAAELAETLDTETSALCARLSEVTAEATSLKTRIVEAAGMADAAVGALLTTTDDVVGAFDLALVGIQRSTRHVGDAAAEASTALEPVAAAADGVRTAAETELRQAVSRIELEAKYAVDSIKESANGCDEARDALHDQQLEWCGTLDRLTIGTAELVKAALQGLAAIADADARGTVDALNAGVERANVLATRLEAHPAELDDALKASLAPLPEAHEVVAAACAERRRV